MKLQQPDARGGRLSKCVSHSIENRYILLLNPLDTQDDTSDSSIYPVLRVLMQQRSDQTLLLPPFPGQ
jgi:hypothetical protein